MTPQEITNLADKFCEIDGINRERFQKVLETALTIHEAWNNGTKIVTVSAPTGFGKSILSMFLAFLEEEQSYILTSNLALQDQYTRDIDRFKLDMASLKGAANYQCNKDVTKNFGNRPCSPLTIKELKKKLPCAAECPYINARDSALNASTAVLNYAFFLTAASHWKSMMGGFNVRNLTICDEGHLLPGLIQDAFSATLNISSWPFMLSKLSGEWLLESRDISKYVKEIINCADTSGRYFEYFEKYRTEDSSKGVIQCLEAIKYHFDQLHSFTTPFQTVKTKEEMSKIEAVAMSTAGFCSGISTKIGKLISIFKMKPEAIVIDIHKSKEDGREEKFSVHFRCLDVSLIAEDMFFQFTERCVIMSATMGNIKVFTEYLGIRSVHIDIESDFDFSKSPIYVGDLSMNYENRNANFDEMVRQVDKILGHFQNESGIIHTGTKDFATRLKQKSAYSDRLLAYSNSKEKAIALARMERNPNKKFVLIGPSLIEGIDLAGDKARFQIFMKVPYESLGDNFVKLTLKSAPAVYSANASNAIEQGTGRCIRSKDDWAETFILDSSYKKLLMQTGIPKNFTGRVKKIIESPIFSNS